MTAGDGDLAKSYRLFRHLECELAEDTVFHTVGDPRRAGITILDVFAP